MNFTSHILITIAILGIDNSTLGQNVSFKSEDNSKQINIPFNKGIVNIKNWNVALNGKSYEELIDKRKKQLQERDKIVERIAKYPNDNSFQEELFTKNAEIEKTEKEINEFTENYWKLSEIFSTINISTNRLKLAEGYFKKNEIEKVDSILKPEDLATDQIKLLNTRKQKEKELEKLNQQISSNAKEYFIKAQAIALQYNNPNRIVLVDNYFELSLKSKRDPLVLSAYAIFSEQNSQLTKAMILYDEALITLRNFKNKNNKHYEILAGIYTRLGILQRDRNDLNNAQISFNNALEIFRKFAKINLKSYSPDLADILYHLGILNTIKNDYQSAEIYFSECLKIRDSLSKLNPKNYMKGLAEILSGIGFIQRNKRDFINAKISYEKSLKIFRELPKDNLEIYLHDLGISLSQIGNLQHAEKDYQKAEISIYESLNIFRELSAKNPSKYLGNVAMCLNNLANVQKDNYKNAVAEVSYIEAIKLYRKSVEIDSNINNHNLAIALINLGDLQHNQFNFINAKMNYFEALKIFKKLAEKNPQAYLPFVGITLLNISISEPIVGSIGVEKTIQSINEAIDILVPFIENGSVQDKLKFAFSILTPLGVDVKTYLQKKYPSNPKLLMLL